MKLDMREDPKVGKNFIPILTDTGQVIPHCIAGDDDEGWVEIIAVVNNQQQIVRVEKLNFKFKHLGIGGWC